MPLLNVKKKAVLCTVCGKVLVSWHRHDCRTCSCDNQTMVDGGDAYLRYGGKNLALVQTIELIPTIKTLFVAQNPTNEVTKLRPLYNTRSGNKLQEWARLAGVQDYNVVNASNKIGKVGVRDYDVKTVLEAVAAHHKIVALGAYASKMLTKLGVKHFQLPHTSGLNRVLNDKEAVAHTLNAFNDWLKREDE